MNCLRISFLCDFVDFRTARIAQPQNSCDLVVSLSDRIISGSSQNFAFGIALHIHDFRMSAACDKRHERRLKLRIFDKIRTDMPHQMMNAYERDVLCKCKGFCRCNSHQKCPDETRAVRNADEINVIKAHLCIFQRLRENTVDVFQMVSGCDFRHNSAEILKYIDL